MLIASATVLKKKKKLAVHNVLQKKHIFDMRLRHLDWKLFVEMQEQKKNKYKISNKLAILCAGLF